MEEMNRMHISTGDTHYIDCPESPELSECPFCGKMSKSQMGWTGIRHMCCKIEINEEDWLGSICKTRRERILKMSRKELGKAIGYSPKTIKRYEWVKCSRKYEERLREYIKSVKPEEKTTKGA